MDHTTTIIPVIEVKEGDVLRTGDTLEWTAVEDAHYGRAKADLTGSDVEIRVQYPDGGTGTRIFARNIHLSVERAA